MVKEVEGMISPKVFAAAAAGMVSIVFWTIAVATFWKGTFTAETLTVLTTVTTTALSSLAAYLVSDKTYVHARSLVEHPMESKLTSRAPTSTQ